MKQSTKRLYSMVFALFFVVIALVIYFELVVPAYTNLQAAKGNLISEQNLLTNEQQIVSEFQTLLTTYKSQGTDEQAISAVLPVSQHLADAVAQLYAIASANGISLQGIGITTQLAPPPGSGTALTNAASTGQVVKPIGTITFTLAGQGSYENIKNLLTAIETNMRLFDVTQVAFLPMGGGVSANGKPTTVPDFFGVNMTLQTYYQSQ
ncbi:MAG TPA: hypothetical protein VMT99_01855 [Candidatus Paceibacterota bacterium]|nr:hypothetical protein [Candidatus Paceibacterota bacterium]